MNNRKNFFLNGLSAVFVFIASTLFVQAQVYLYQKDGWLGLKDYTSDKIITPAAYDDIKQCESVYDAKKDSYEDKTKTVKAPINFWVVQQNGLYGLVNKSGKTVVPVEYTYINYELKYGFVFLMKNKNYYLADTTGKTIFKSKDKDFKQTNAFVYSSYGKDTTEIINCRTNQLFKLPFKINLLNEEAKLVTTLKDTSVYTFEGNRILPKNKDDHFSFQGNYILCQNKPVNTIFNSKGKILFQDSCQNIKVVNKKNFLVTYEINKYTHRYIIKDSTGKTIMDVSSLSEPTFLNHYFMCRTDKGNVKTYTYKIYSYDGKPILENMAIMQIEPCGYNYLGKLGKTRLLIDSTGAILKEFFYDHVQICPDAPYMLAQSDDKEYVLSTNTGQIILQHDTTNYKYANIWNVSTISNGTYYFVHIQKGQKYNFTYGILDMYGKEIVPLKYQSILIQGNMFLAKNSEGDKLDTYDFVNGKISFNQISFTDRMQTLVPGLAFAIPLLKDSISGYIIYNKNFKEVMRTRELPYIYKAYYLIAKPAINTKYGLWGINGEAFVKPQYDKITPINPHSYIVKQNMAYGVIDVNDRHLVPFEYDDIKYDNEDSLLRCKKNNLITVYKKTSDNGFVRTVNNFYQEIKVSKETNSTYFIVKENSKWGIVTVDAVFIPIVYDKIETYKNLIVLYKDNEIQFTSFSQPKQITESYRSYTCSVVGNNRGTDKNTDVIVNNKEKFGVLNNQCQWILNPVYDRISYQKNNLYMVYQNKKQGIFYNGSFVTPVDLDSVFYFNSSSKYYFYFYRSRKYYLITLDKKQQVSQPYNKIISYSGNFLIVNKNNTYGVLDQLSNKLVIDTIYQNIYYSGQAGKLIIKQNNKYGLVSENGGIILRVIYDSIELLYSADFYRVQKNGMYGICDLAGKELLPCTYSSIETTAEYVKKTIASEQQERYSTSKTLSADHQISMLLKKNLFLVKEKGVFGVIDRNQKIIIPIQYDSIGENGYGYELQQANKYGYADHTGRVLISVVYDEIDKVEQADAFYFYDNKKMGIVSMDSKILIKPLYDDIEYDPEAKVYIMDKGDSSGVANTLGEIIIPVKYDDIDVYKTHCFVGNTDDRYAIFSFNSNKFITGFSYDDYEEKGYRNFTYYILTKETEDDDLLSLYIPDDPGTPLKAQYVEITYNSSKEQFKLYFPEKGEKQLYQTYSMGHVLSKPMDY